MSRAALNTPQPCPCGNTTGQGRRAVPAQLQQCCGRYIGLPPPGLPAPDACALMRSRYSAYVLLCDDYLLATWHPDTRPATLDLNPAGHWLGLEVRDYRQLDATSAEVEFVARVREGGRATRMHERSRFILEHGRWWYVDGVFLP